MVILQNTTDLQTFRLLQKSVVGEANIHPAHCCELGSVSLDITENGEYSVLPPRGCDGISSADITIDVPDNYNEGFEDGVEEQKSKLTSLAVYSNGTYTREDGYNEVVVNVPTSGDCVDWSAAGFSCNDLDFINEQMPVIQEAKAYLDSGRTANGTTPIGNTGYTFNELVLLPSGKYVSLQSCTAAILAGDVVSTYYSEFFFMGCSALNSIRSFTLLGGSAPTNTQFMFSDCASLRKAPTVDTSATTNAMWMYYGCRNLSSGFATSFPLATDCSSIFEECYNITSYPALYFPSATTLSNAFNVAKHRTNKASENCEFTSITTSSALQNCSYMFCGNGIKTCPVFNTENVTNFNSMFSICEYLTEVPALDYGKGIEFNSFVFGDLGLTTIPLMDMKSAQYIRDMFFGCTSLANAAGFENLGEAFTTDETLDMSSCSALTKQSVLNIFNYLSAPDASGVYPVIMLHSDVYDQLTSADLAIATEKRWAVQRI